MSDEPNLNPEEARAIQSAIEKLVDENTEALSSFTPRPASREHAEDSPAPAPAPVKKAAPAPLQALASDLQKSHVSDWFFTFMCMNIPLVGWIYLFHLAFGRGRTDRREFARAYLFYKLLFLIISLAILAAVALIAMDMLDKLLAYMQML